MAEKDVTEKLLEDYEDVFADIVNVLLFNGEQVIKETDLERAQALSTYKIDDKPSWQERDVAKFIKSHNVIIALCGFENQTQVHNYMPLRTISYDGAAYRHQLKSEAQKEKYPVITLVLYFGKTHWDESKMDLYSVLDIPENLKPYVNNYRINLFEIAFLSPEQVSMFKSDFKFVAEYFTQTREDKEYRPSAETVKHVEEVLNLMTVLTKNDSFKNAIDGIDRKEPVTMDMVVNKLFVEAEEKGRTEGRTEIIKNALSRGKSYDEISEFTGMSVEEIERIDLLIR